MKCGVIRDLFSIECTGSLEAPSSRQHVEQFGHSQKGTRIVRITKGGGKKNRTKGQNWGI